MPTVEAVYSELKQVFDPEIPVNIVDLGLVYEVTATDASVNVRMTLTSQACPEAKTIPDVIRRRIKSNLGVENPVVDIVWDPPWTPQKISPEGRKLLGIDEEEPIG